MKNPFKQYDNTSTWIAAAIAGAAAVGVVAYLYFRKREQDDDEPFTEHVSDYMHIPRKQKKRTDLSELQDLVSHN